jgi:hypothetical protein
MDNIIDINRAKCTKLSFGAPIEFLRADNTTLSGFDIVAYTGAVVERWWGKLAVDVAGISAAQQMPIFKNHDRDQIVGYSTKTEKGKSFFVSGIFSKTTKAASEVMGLASEGFPWQASIGVAPKKILELKENTSTIVNGQEISGPAEIWLESEVFETSFVPLGADGDTSIAVFSDVQEITEDELSKRAVVPKNSMRSTMDLTKLKAEHPDLVAAITQEATAGFEARLAEAKEEGAKLEMQRIKDVRLQLVPGHEALIEKLAFDGKTTGPEAAVAVIQAENKLRSNALEALEADAPKIVPETNTDNSQKLSKEDKAKADWDKSPELQAEFAGDFELYLYSMKDQPGIKIKTLNTRGEKI